MTTPDTTTPEALIEENAASTATQVVEPEPAAPEAPSEVTEEIEAPVAQAVATDEPVTTTAVAAPVATETAVAETTAVVVEEEPQSTVFSLVTFFLAALPIIGVILNAIAVARAGKEGFDLWLARWGLALAIIETVGALLLVGLGYYFGLLSAGAV
ncbi:hypothetical protein AB1046_16070 [Promicromonospora sp. Populi]|uniref:hypothetical protein n=1 Tax=Promicromonospora sp. Populi TaxID=3239420 RepID=UPI0034E1E3D3